MLNQVIQSLKKYWKFYREKLEIIMKNFIKSIVNFFKSIFGQDIKVSVENNKKYDIKKNENCNININEHGGNNEKGK